MRTVTLCLLALALGACGGATPTATHVHETHAAPPSAPSLPATDQVAMPSSSPVVTIRVAYYAGSAYDPPGKSGLTTLTARLMTDGGTEALSYAELTERLFPMAAELSAQVDREETVFVGRVHRDHLNAFYEIFRDVLARPRLAAIDFERVQNQMKSELELELRGNNDEELGKQMLQAMLYEGHPYGHPDLGTETGIGRITLADVRTHRERVFCGARAAVGLAGGYPEGFAERVRADVSVIGAAQCERTHALLATPADEGARIWLVDKPEAASVAVSLGMTLDVTRAHEDYPALILAMTFFGQHRQFIGRLMQKMRGDRGLNYGDYAYAEHFEQEGWGVYPLPNLARRQQYFSIWLRPVKPENAHFAVRMAIRELRNLVEHGLTAEELEQVRNFASSYYALFLQTESRRLGFALDDVYYGLDQPYMDRMRAAWAALTPEALNAALRRHIDPDRLQIAIVTKDAEALANALASEAPSPITYAAEVSESVLAEDREITTHRIGIPRDRMRVVPLADTFR